MGNTFRVRYRSGDFEIEVESSEKAYVDSKLEEFLKDTKKKTSDQIKPKVKKNQPRQKNVSPKSEGQKEGIDVMGLVAHIKDSDDYDELQKNIIDKRDMLPRIIMCLKYAADFLDSPHLTTGQIEQLTDQLGIKMQMANVGKCIMKNQRYFTGKKVRKPGVGVPYKLNRQGEKAFEKFLKGEKL